MKFIRFIDAGNVRCQGILEQDRIEIIAGDMLTHWHKTGRVITTGQIMRWLPPIVPPNILAVGHNYLDHVKELENEIPKTPLIFIKAGTSLNAHREPIVVPRVAPDFVDFEAELAIIIGKQGRHIPEDQALDHIFGYTIANDVTARDVQKWQDSQWARAKSFDSFCPIGPWIETEYSADNRSVRSILNGQVMQNSNTHHFIFSLPRLISFISGSMTLLPGTLILTGTPPGVGFARNPRVNMKPGDTIVIEIEGLGRLENPLVAEA